MEDMWRLSLLLLVAAMLLKVSTDSAERSDLKMQYGEDGEIRTVCCMKGPTSAGHLTLNWAIISGIGSSDQLQ